MSTQSICYSFSAPAAGDLSAKQFHFVKIDTSGNVAVAGAGEIADGVLQNNPDAATKMCTVAAVGIAKVVYGAGITAGDAISVDANGHAVAASAGASVIGKALATGVANDVKPILLKSPSASATLADSAVTPAKLAASAVETAKIDDDAVTLAKAAVFISTEQTGTGASQNVAHGLGATPTGVLVVPTDGGTAVEGTHTGTNVVVTVTTDKKFKVLAWA